MSASFFRLDGWVQTPTGEAVPGASVAVLDQPADFTTQPGSPLSTIYGAPQSNSATITGASWFAQQITFQFSAPPPADVVPGSYIGVSGASPATYNSTLEDPWLVVQVIGNDVIVEALNNPGAYSSGGTVATSVLPNPLTTDGNGHYFFYTLPGSYSVQVYGSTIAEQDYPDQDIGTVAGGSVLSVGLTLPAEFSITGSPVTTSGTLAATWANEAANKVFAGPTTGAPGTPAFRSLVAADLPAGVGTVTSVGLTLAVPGIFTESVGGTPVTGSGTLAATIGLQTQLANVVWAGPTSGGAGAPTFRGLVNLDLPVPLSIADLLTTPAQPTFRLIESELELSSAVTSISGSVAGVRGAVTIDAGGTLGGASYVYGVQGKLIPKGTLNNGSAFNAGFFGQLDTSNAGFAHTSGYLAPLILDYGATSHLASDPLGDMMVALNTTTSLINSILKTEAKANYLFDLNDLGQGNYIVAGAVGGSQDKKLAILINGTPYFIALNTA